MKKGRKGLVVVSKDVRRKKRKMHGKKYWKKLRNKKKAMTK